MRTAYRYRYKYSLLAAEDRRPRDVSGVKLLQSQHESLKAEIDAHDEHFFICIKLARDLLQHKHFRSDEVLLLLTSIGISNIQLMLNI